MYSNSIIPPASLASHSYMYDRQRTSRGTHKKFESPYGSFAFADILDEAESAFRPVVIDVEAEEIVESTAENYINFIDNHKTTAIAANENMSDEEQDAEDDQLDLLAYIANQNQRSVNEVVTENTFVSFQEQVEQATKAARVDHGFVEWERASHSTHAFIENPYI